MEKLLNLLNEFEEKRIKKINADWKLIVKLSFRPYTKEALTNQAYQSVQNEIISKYYWFIKRLVDNDKIETDWILSDNLTYTYFQIPQEYYMWWCQSLMMQMNKLFYLRIVACLSIQDNPIDFLISILK